jgi:hypothetical protein
MDLKKLIERKKKFKEDIENLINDFEKETDNMVFVESIDVHGAYCDNGNKRHVAMDIQITVN